MVAVDLYPAIDLRGGRVVRLTKGDYDSETVYGDDPVDVAASFADAGAPWVHVVDLDAARSGDPVNRPVVAAIAAALRGRARLQNGGGVRTLADARALADAGVDRVVMGSAAVSDPELVELAGEVVPVAVGLDHRDGDLAVHGWTESSGVRLGDALSRFPTAAAFVITDISRDGMLTGPDVVGLSAGGRRNRGARDRQRRRVVDRRHRRIGGDSWPGWGHHRQGDLRGPLHRGRGARCTPGGGTVKVARVIPCLDVTGGRVVKGTNFVDLRDAGDPVELAARYDAEGADELVFLDITASSDDRDTTVEMVFQVAEQVYIPFTVGGGIRSLEDARRMLRAGADKVSVNTAAVQRPELISEIAAEFGSQCVVCAIDAKRRGAGVTEGFEVYLHGGRTSTGIDAIEWARRAVEMGAGEILLTSMDRDGTRRRFRSRVDEGDRRCRQRARHRQRWGRHTRPSRRRHRRRSSRRRAGGIDLPLPGAHDRRGQGSDGRRRRARSAHPAERRGSGTLRSGGWAVAGVQPTFGRTECA